MLTSQTIDLRDPASVLEADVAYGTIAGIPTVTVKPESVLADFGAVRDAMTDMLEEALAREKKDAGLIKRLLRTGSGNWQTLQASKYALPTLVHQIPYLQKEMMRGDGILPVCSLFSDPRTHRPAPSVSTENYKAPHAALIVMPGENFNILRAMARQGGLSRTACVLPAQDKVNFAGACHEFGHVAGAQEPQADKIAA